MGEEIFKIEKISKRNKREGSNEKEMKEQGKGTSKVKREAKWGHSPTLDAEARTNQSSGPYPRCPT